MTSADKQGKRMSTDNVTPLTTAEFNAIVELIVLWKSIADDRIVTKEEIGLLGTLAGTA